MSDNLIALAKKNFDRQKVFNELAEQCASEPIMDIALDKIESLRQQLADSQHNYASLETAFNEMKELAGERLKQIMILRDALETLWLGTDLSEWDGVAIKIFKEALAATADLKDVILCHAEPVASAFVTGSTNSKATIAFDYGADLKMNTPASGKSLPLYRAWEPKQ